VLLYAHATQARLWLGSHRIIAEGRLSFGLPPGRLSAPGLSRASVTGQCRRLPVQRSRPAQKGQTGQVEPS
jgi:hypothetical protein